MKWARFLAAIAGLISAWYIVWHGSFYTFANMAEVSEIVVVCDPSYRDIFEGLWITNRLTIISLLFWELFKYWNA